MSLLEISSLSSFMAIIENHFNLQNLTRKLHISQSDLNPFAIMKRW